ncbi:hypothetical protein F8M41_024395 [Gigaspora margarita]|uniref:Uncharacterized protein n=1 Tax=Gigaspora margarita TaxID=4874 RepID=A0A8H3XMU5_GIGMA|nr:hypothetical protein F8M41_024395 [Gigaspora margarita]
MNEDYKDYDFYLRIGLDGTPSLVDGFANKFDGRVYNETLHTHVITTNVHLDNYTIKVELLKTGWNLRPNINYYRRNEYGDYLNDKMPIMIVVDKNKQESQTDILKEAKIYVEDVLLFDKTLTKENTIEILKEYIECMYKLLNFKEIKNLPNKQFELMMKRAIRLYLYEISKSITDGKQIDDVLNEDTILSFLSLSVSINFNNIHSLNRIGFGDFIINTTAYSEALIYFNIKFLLREYREYNSKHYSPNSPNKGFIINDLIKYVTYLLQNMGYV